jgi:hypothetical protein
MPPRTLTLCRLAAAALLTVASRGLAQTAGSSPFMPPQAVTAQATQGAPIEYRGHIDTSEGVLYRVYDPSLKAGAYLKLNERDPNLDVVVKSHDADREMLTIEHHGRPLTLELRVAKIVSAGAPQMMMPMPQPQQPNVSPAVIQSVVVNPTPAEEQKRLEAVAAEVQRRRALREQAQQQINPGAVPQVAMPQPQQPVQQPQQAQRPMQNNPNMQRGRQPGRPQ